MFRCVERIRHPSSAPWTHPSIAPHPPPPGNARTATSRDPSAATGSGLHGVRFPGGTTVLLRSFPGADCLIGSRGGTPARWGEPEARGASPFLLVRGDSGGLRVGAGSGVAGACGEQGTFPTACARTSWGRGWLPTRGRSGDTSDPSVFHWAGATRSAGNPVRSCERLLALEPAWLRLRS